MRTVFLDFASLHPSDLNTKHLSDHLTSIEFWAESHDETINSRLQDAEVVVVNKISLQRRHLENAPHLKLICLAATGSDNIDIVAAQELGIAVANIRDYCTPSVIQHVFALILTLTQKLDSHRRQVRVGAWQQASDFCLLDPCFDELHEKTLGVIGLGALGSGVTGVAQAFGMRVVAASLPWRRAGSSGGGRQSVPRLPLHELLQQADIVSLHCPLTDETHHMIDKDALAQMQTHALLINTARGALIDSIALADALKNKRIGGAGIDVLATEPPLQGDPLLDYLTAAEQPENLIITPHMAWGARESRQRALDQILANIKAFAAGDSLNRLC